MKKIIKHYPMTGQLIVTQGYVLKLHFHLTTNLNYSKEACKKVEIACMYLDVCGNEWKKRISFIKKKKPHTLKEKENLKTDF